MIKNSDFSLFATDFLKEYRSTDPQIQAEQKSKWIQSQGREN